MTRNSPPKDWFFPIEEAPVLATATRKEETNECPGATQEGDGDRAIHHSRRPIQALPPRVCDESKRCGVLAESALLLQENLS